MAWRTWHEAEGHGVMRLIAPRGSRRSFEVRDLLERNLLPVRWYDVDTDAESAALLDWLDIPREETPVLVHATEVMRNPSAAQVARSLGLRAEVDGERFDLVVLGAGPAGLAAAVYGGSEGLRTLVAEAWAPGGQAGTSTRIENYLGFPIGISGTELTRKATLQARRFDAVLSSFHRAVELADGPEGLLRVDLDDGQHVLARSVVVATGARWRELKAEGVDRFRGAGVYHAAMATDAERCRGEDVIVVGGGNSAGQAAVHLASRARSVRIVVRGKALKSTMSQYLVDRIERSATIEVMTETEIAAVDGSATVDTVRLRDRRDGSVEQVGVHGRLRDDRRRPVHRGDDGDPRASTTRATCSAAPAPPTAQATCAGRSTIASHACSRRRVPACSPPATCGRTRPSASRARSATVRSSCASRTRCSPADGSPELIEERLDRLGRPLLLETGHDGSGELRRRALAGLPVVTAPALEVVAARDVAEAHRGLVDGLLEARRELRLRLHVALAGDDQRRKLAPVGDLVLGHQIVS